MSADLQYRIKFSDLPSNFFDRLTWVKDQTIKLIKETVESRFSANIDLTDYLTRVLTEADFESIEYYRSRIERLESQDELELAAELRAEFAEAYDDIAIESYDKARGIYSEYIELLGLALFENLDDYKEQMQDEEVLVETWI